MTNVRLIKNKNSYEATAVGHAGFGECGTDIVCAAISMLTYAFGQLCAEYEAQNLVTIEKLEMRDGVFDIVVCDTMNVIPAAWKMLLLGMQGIENNYPLNISLEWGES